MESRLFCCLFDRASLRDSPGSLRDYVAAMRDFSGPIARFPGVYDTFGHKPIAIKRKGRPFSAAFLMPIRCLLFISRS